MFLDEKLILSNSACSYSLYCFFAVLSVSTEKRFSAGMEQMCFNDRDRTSDCSYFRILSKTLVGMQVYSACTDVFFAWCGFVGLSHIT